MDQVVLKQRILPRVRRVVVKLGSSVVASASGVDRENAGRVVGEIARLHANGYEVIVVTSGARAAGLARLGLRRMPSSIPEQQAAAAIGQIRLMAIYEEFFSSFGQHIGQVLLTAADIENRVRYLNARHTLDHLLAHRIVPVVNENDSVAVDELKFGDNDRLSALVAGLAGAHLLVLLTDVDGVFDRDPRSGSARHIEILTGAQADVAIGAVSALGSGGMRSKLAAARSAARRGIPTIIANGRVPGTLAGIFDVRTRVGTLVPASDSPMSNRKHWIAYGMPVRGALTLDAGAVRALSTRGGSLLPSGVIAVHGRFDPGECVSCTTESGEEFARGLVAYDSRDCARIKGLSSARIRDVLGYHMGDEIIHRDDLVLLSEVGSQASTTGAAK